MAKEIEPTSKFKNARTLIAPWLSQAVQSSIYMDYEAIQ